MSKSFPLLLETIKIEDGVISHLDYHQKRFDNSRKALYGKQEPLLLKESINSPSSGLYRCRILYHTKIYSIEYIPYKAKNITTVQMVETSLYYPYKYADRTSFDKLLNHTPHADDILIIQDATVTDTSIANIAFFDGVAWYTPKKPLLKGTTRQRLIDEDFLICKDIYIEDLPRYTHVALMNAMLGFKILKNVTIFDTKGKPYDY